MYKDHLVTWVEEYLKITHGSSKGSQILDEIDRRSVVIFDWSLNCSLISLQELPWFPYSLAFVDSNRGEISSSGLEMTPRRS